LDEAKVPFKAGLPSYYARIAPKPSPTSTLVICCFPEKLAQSLAPPSDPRTYMELLCSPHRSLFPDPPFWGTGNPKEDREGFHLKVFKDYRRTRADAMVIAERNVLFLQRKMPEGSPHVGLYMRSVANQYRRLGDEVDGDAWRHFQTYPAPMSEKSLHAYCRDDIVETISFASHHRVRSRSPKA
jgi:hypothetical protein